MTKSTSHSVPNQQQMLLPDMPYVTSMTKCLDDIQLFPTKGMSTRDAYQLVHDSLKSDGDPALNCSTFLTTQMEPEADKLIMENLGKNRVEEYKVTERIHERCLAHLHELWGGAKGQDVTGTVVVGSSEGIMLGGLAMKWRWRQRRQAAGKDASRPNIVFGANAQVALEKTARYFDIEARLVPASAKSNYCLDTHKALEMIDENTIGMFVILGSTYTGHYEDVAGMSQLLVNLHKEKGLDVPIHVDGAGGAFVAPFAHPDLLWDFRVPRVVSISASGHKFGLTYPGIAWVLWRAPEYLPDGLTFELSYLGGTEKTFTLNFSHPACFLIAQYYQFIRLGREGYARVMNACMHHARLLSVALEATGVYQCISDIHRPRGQFGFSEETRLASADLFDKSVKVQCSGADLTPNRAFNYGLPEVVFHFSSWFVEMHPTASQDVVATLMRERGWIMTNYPLPPGATQLCVMRVVIKEALSSEDFVDRFVHDLVWTTKTMLDTQLQSVDETLCMPLAKNPSTSKLAHSLARTGLATRSGH